MNDRSCRRCGNKALLCGFISMHCPICGECVYNPDASEKNQWSEHTFVLYHMS